MKAWLRRFAIRRFDLIDGPAHRGMDRILRTYENENSKLRAELRQAFYRIDELNKTVDQYRKDVWRPALKKALDDNQKAANQ